MNYRKFADDLESHSLFEDIRTNFRRRGFLTQEEFFSIVIWKANRAKRKVRKKIKSVEKLTRAIHDATDNKRRLEILLNAGLRLPMASAVLSVLSPEFAVYDFRVREQIGMQRDISGLKNVIELYFNEYLAMVEREGKGRTVREKGQYLWGRSFYESLIDFLKER